jgi:dihydrofolate reductase
MPLFVVWWTLTEPALTTSTVIAGVAAAEIAALRERTDGDILVNGSVQLVQTLVEADLVDEYRLMVFPVLLGAGKRLFGETVQKPLRLVETLPVGPDGVVVLTYRPAGA